MDKLLYSRKEAAHTLSVSVRQLDYLIEHGHLVPTRVGRRVNIHIDRLRRFANGDHPHIQGA